MNSKKKKAIRYSFKNWCEKELQQRMMQTEIKKVVKRIKDKEMASTPKKMLILEPQNQGRHAKSWNSPTKGLKENSKKIENWKIRNDQTSENCFRSFSLVLSIKNKEKTPNKGSVSNVNNIRLNTSSKIRTCKAKAKLS